jgi:imidazolonepropionase
VAPHKLADLVLWEAEHEGAFAWAYGLKPRVVWLRGTQVFA